MKKVAHLATPVALLFVALFTFGIFVSQLGYYWDDWIFAWTREHLGREGLVRIFDVTRPLRGWIEAFLTSILGVKPIAWQIYALLMRWLAAVFFWWFLGTLWPDRRWLASLAAILFLVYPGFTQQPLAMTYHYYWTFATLFFVSLGLMLKSLHPSRFSWLQMSVAVGLSGLGMWAMEYLFGLELLRPVFLWIMLSRAGAGFWSRLKRTVLSYVPFALVTVIFLYWRFVIYQHSVYTLDSFGVQDTASLFSLSALFSQVGKAVPLVSLGAWLQVLQQPFAARQTSLLLAIVYGVILVGGAVGVTSFFKTFSPGHEDASGWRERSGIVGVAVLMVLFAGLPFYLLDFPIRLTFPEDRFILAFMPGVSLLMAGLLGLIKNPSIRFTFAALLVPLAATLHIHNADVYRDEWRSQRAFIWQLSWRAPIVEPGTIFLSEDQAVFPHNDDEAFAFLINWAYAPDSHSPELAYDYFFVSARLGNELPGLKRGLPVFANHFSATYQGTTDQVVVVRFAPPACLRVLDPVYDADAPVAPRGVRDPYASDNTLGLTLPRTVSQALLLSNPAEVIGDGAQSALQPEWLFGPEPERRWCYYFQKADLARQQSNWQDVASIGDQVFRIPFYPDDPSEYLPFIEAYGRLGRDEDARALTEKAADQNPILRPMLCAAWQRIGKAGSLSLDTIKEIQGSLRYCPVEDSLP